MKKDNPILDAALEYHDLGLHVIPIEHNGKRPLVKWKQYQRKQPSVELLTKWFTENPKANLAIITGTKGGFDVVDFDPLDDKGTLAVFGNNGDELPGQCLVKTPRLGRHNVFKHTKGVKNSAGEIATGVDIRGTGGYVLAPPSSIDGVSYEFIQGSLSDVEDPFPKWLLDLVLHKQEAGLTPDQAAERFDRLKQKIDDAVTTAYGRKALKAECLRVAQAPEGERNNTLNKAAFAIGQLVNAKHVDAGMARSDLLKAAAIAGLTELEVISTLKSGLRAASQKPRESTPDPAKDKKKKKRESLPEPVLASKWCDEKIEQPKAILDGLFDAGTKATLMGPSKARKTFLTLQLLLSLAAGLDSFLKWNIAESRRVLIFQFEVMAWFFQQRIKSISQALGMSHAQLEDRFHVVNARGKHVDLTNIPEIIEIIKKTKADVVCFDPIYKMLTGDESKQEHVKPLLEAIDVVCEETGAAFLYSHHYAKGLAGDRQTVDRGSGSGLLARDYDLGLYLSPHRREGLFVIEARQRNHPEIEPFSIRWDNLIFKLDDEAPVVQTTRNTARGTGKLTSKPVTTKVVLELFNDGALTMAEFERRLCELTTQRNMRAFKSQLLAKGTLVKQKIGAKGRGSGQWMIGRRSQLRDLFAEQAEIDSQENL